MTPEVDKTGVTRADIEALLPRFYDAVRRDPRLGPIFLAHVGETDEDWAPHLTKIADCWANVMLKERAYHGNPLVVHNQIEELKPTDFAIWLTLFDKAAAEVLSPRKAQAFSILAHRIGRSLKMGVAQARGEGPPQFAV
ncbi:MAG: group III truncated hemoglobin [Pseudomonadota bacterium]